MGTKPTTVLTSGWVLDEVKQLFHYYREEPGMAAHRPLCEGSLLLTTVVRRRAQAVLPDGLKGRYGTDKVGKVVGVCMSCSNRHGKLK